MSELDEIKKRRLEELQSEQSKEQEENARFQQQFAQLEAMVKPILSPEALQRYGNVKIAHPDIAISAMVALAQLVQSGKVSRVNDATFKALLMRLQKPKREIKIKHK